MSGDSKADAIFESKFIVSKNIFAVYYSTDNCCLNFKCSQTKKPLSHGKVDVPKTTVFPFGILIARLRYNVNVHPPCICQFFL